MGEAVGVWDKSFFLAQTSSRSHSLTRLGICPTRSPIPSQAQQQQKQQQTQILYLSRVKCIIIGNPVVYIMALNPIFPLKNRQQIVPIFHLRAPLDVTQEKRRGEGLMLMHQCNIYLCRSGE